MADIIPAILSTSWRTIHDDLDMVAGRVHTVQIDICDGVYVHSKTWPYVTGTADINFDALLNQEVGLPHWEELDFQFDLMVKDVLKKMPDFVSIGASSIVVHRGSISDEELDNLLNEYGSHTPTMSDFGIRIGLAYPPEKDIALDIAQYRNRIDFVQVMGIEKIGFQGQPLSPKAIEAVREVRSRFPDLEISVDGGVTTEGARALIDAGADALVVGSAIFGEHDSQDALNAFLKL